MGRPSSPTAGSAAAVRTAASPVCPCAARTCGCPAGTVPTPRRWMSQENAALSGCATREGGWGSSPSQPMVSTGLVQGRLEVCVWGGGWGGLAGGNGRGLLGARTPGHIKAKVILTKSGRGQWLRGHVAKWSGGSQDLFKLAKQEAVVPIYKFKSYTIKNKNWWQRGEGKGGLEHLKQILTFHSRGIT